MNDYQEGGWLVACFAFGGWGGSGHLIYFGRDLGQSERF